MPQCIWLLALAFHTILHAATINQTQLTICSRTFTNCTDNVTSDNCTADFFDCMKHAEIRSKRPQSCYQADAAATCFQTAIQVSGAIFAASILAAIMPTIINWIQSAKCWNGCCTNCCTSAPKDTGDRFDGEDPSDSAKDTFTIDIVEKAASKALSNFDYLKKVSTATFGQIAAYFSIAISFASAGQLFNLWQAWTVATANCEFDMAK